MKLLTQTYEIHAPAGKVWQALVDPKIIDEWGGGPAVMSDEVGFDWTLWGGQIFGKNTEVIPKKKLVQDWYDDKDLKEPTICTFELSEKGGVTTVKLTHTNIPDESLEQINTGWNEYYLGPLKALVEKSS